MEKILEVNNLQISFRTTNGKVQAVRDITFDLHQGETLAIVGESGSGKSVTSRAILGILAGNAIVERGEIIYDGKDLLRITEDDFHKIRGDKIAMIFQDPMSSLNPIVRIGRQLTEAMILKNRLTIKESKKIFEKVIKVLVTKMKLALPEVDGKDIDAMFKTFRSFEKAHVNISQSYNYAHASASECLDKVNQLIFEIPKEYYNNVPSLAIDVVKLLRLCVDRYVFENEKAVNFSTTLKTAFSHATKTKKYDALLPILEEIKGELDATLALAKPDFFAIAYYLVTNDNRLPADQSIAELNAQLTEYLQNNFLDAFEAKLEKTIRFVESEIIENKKKAIELLKESLNIFKAEELNKKEVVTWAADLKKVVLATINPLATKKQSSIYVFSNTLNTMINNYFKGIEKNDVERIRFAKETAKREKIVTSGKVPSWQVVPLSLVDLDIAKENISKAVQKLIDVYELDLAAFAETDYREKTSDLVNYLSEKSAGMGYVLSRQTAKHRAIKLMEEVGIPDARKRFRQYPFQFSGGMRQRIVIAIALTANPNILICDEPTTALDVTIQAQILELINRLKESRNLSIIFITHDLGVVANMSDRIAVMYAGKIVEHGTVDDIFYDPRHPYTWALLSSMPDLDTKEKLESIPGTPPNMIYPPKGDAFALRNKYAMEIDFELQPPLFAVSDTHFAATWLLHPDAPKIDPPEVVTNRIKRMKEGQVNIDESK